MQRLKQNLEKNGFEVLFTQTQAQALELAKEYIKDGMKIGLGGSTTVQNMGLLDYLLKHKNLEVCNQYEAGISMEENTRRRREGILSDLFIAGCNAITRNGEIVNADGSGNRVAAQIFGPKKVLLCAGKNKIVDTVADGFKRIMEVAAIKNIDRMNQKSIEMGKEPRHNIENIANKFAYINGDVPGRTTIIIIDEDLGY